MTATKEDILHTEPSKQRHSTPRGKASGRVRRYKEQEESRGQSLYCSFHGKEWNSEGRQAEQSADGMLSITWAGSGL
jgi:hypothetical protein